MNYTDSAFPVFFVITFIIYYLCRASTQQLVVLVVSSLVFYAWEALGPLVVFLASWLITGITSYGVLAAPPDSAARKRWAILGVAVNLALLGFFKYKFLIVSGPEAEAAGSTLARWLLMAPLPIGISFYTFHGISLLVDIYRGRSVDAFPGAGHMGLHLGHTLLYLVFFPQLIAGPIIKAKDFFPQVGLKKFSDIDFPGSARILILGLFLKSVIADNLSEQTYWIAFPHFQARSSLDLILLLYGYSAQIFADFAGYSLIAIGLARLMGYRLPDNFDFPYFATSIGEFWRKWHISLSSWLRDYLYIPLGGNQKGSFRTYLNLILVMFLGGLWHGAAWSFAIWGLWHGIGLALERRWRKSTFLTSNHPALRVVRIVLVFQFVTLGWLFFKLQNFSEAMLYFEAIFTSDIKGVSKAGAILLVGYSSAVFLYHLAHAWRSRLPAPLVSVGYGAMLFFVIVNSGPSTPFIYFQF